ncbi:MAG TPA: Fic family protein [Rhodospirillales bacterium]|nr:Fic family protein [Rhodospirillales bacterium]
MDISCSHVQLSQKNGHIMFDRIKPYNELPSLPIADDVIDKAILIKWGLASRALAELNKNILRIPNPTMLVNTIALQEAQSSTAIENIFTTEDELYKAVSDAVKEQSANPSTKEVLRYREALWEGFKGIQENGVIDKELIIRIYQKVKNTNQEIRSPQAQVVIKRGQSELRPGEIVYTPPRGEGIVEQKLENLIDYLNNDMNTDPLLKMVIAHYQFEAIHPFSDGNGRTGRILNLLYLVSQGLISHPVLYLSKYIIEHKDDYYYSLSAVTQQNSWGSWIEYMLEAVLQTSKQTNQKIDDILSQMNATYEFVNPKLKWYSKELNQALFSQPYIKQKTIGVATGIRSRTTLSKYVKELIQLGVLSSKDDGKEVFYINNDLLRILEG